METIALILQTAPNPEAIRHMVMGLMAVLPFLVLIGIAIVMVPCWLILKKAGFSPWLALLCIVPTFGALILLYVLAFADWKVVPAPPPQSYWPPQPPYPPPPYPPPPPAPPQV